VSDWADDEATRFIAENGFVHDIAVTTLHECLATALREAYERDRDRLTARVAELKGALTALRPYADHDAACCQIGCDCGFDGAIALADEAAKESG
jgi:hypothetical protein